MPGATCPVHPHVTLTTFCPACRGSQGGKSTSSYKRDAARENIAKTPTHQGKKPARRRK